MFRTPLIALTCALLLPQALRAQVVSDEERAEGFVSMFNGQDFSGWQFGGGYALPEVPKNWLVEDGMIKVTGGGGPHLGSQWDYEDFDMRFEWRSVKDRYNSGFFIRSKRKVGSNQINLAKGGEGRFFGGQMKGGPAVPDLQNAPTEWNRWRVLVVGDKVTFFCNGKQAWEGTEFGDPRGHIGLQAEGAALDFRNLRIKEIGALNLCDIKQWTNAGDHWKQTGDALASDGQSQPLVTLRDDYGDFVLRLEWRDAKGAGGKMTLLGSDGRESVDLAAVKDAANPSGQWNYFELRRTGDDAKAWLNGKTLDGKLATGKSAVSVTDAGGSLELRNVRIKELKE